MTFTTRPVTPIDAAEFESYSYPPPNDFYNSTPGSRALILDPENRYVSVVNKDGDLWGFGCVGTAAQVRGGRCTDSSTLDVGVGMGPARVGQGFGRAFCAVIVSHAVNYGATQLQVTVAAFNVRSLRVWSALGFVECHRFVRLGSSEPYVQLNSTAE